MANRVIVGGRVSAKRFGYSGSDDTSAVQSAIDAGGAAAEVPAISGAGEWVVGPLTLANGVALFLQDGGRLKARSGDYGATNKNILAGNLLSPVRIIGSFESIVEGLRESLSVDNTGPHNINLRGCTNVTIEGIYSKNSSGDAIYLGADTTVGRVPCEDVIIRNFVGDAARRQGISITAGRRIRIENSTLTGTLGASPQSGLDIEPNHADDPAVDITVQHCLARNNGPSDGSAGNGYVVSLSELTTASDPVSILFDHCVVDGTHNQCVFVNLDDTSDAGPGGTIEFRDCTFIGGRLHGALITYDVGVDYLVKFVRCRFVNNATSLSRNAIGLAADGDLTPSATGGVVFEDCIVEDRLANRSPVWLDLDLPLVDPDDLNNIKISGDIRVINPALPLGAYTDHGINALTITVVAG